MKNPKLKNPKSRKVRSDRIDPDHFTVFELKEGWELEASKYCSQEMIEEFKKRQELLKTIPEAIRIRPMRTNHIGTVEWILGFHR